MTTRTTLNEITCPYCGEAHEDIDKLCNGDHSGTMRCQRCGQPFSYRADFTTEWTTTPTPPPEPRP